MGAEQQRKGTKDSSGFEEFKKMAKNACVLTKILKKTNTQIYNVRTQQRHGMMLKQTKMLVHLLNNWNRSLSQK